MGKIRVGVIGATGYTGFELIALLLHHPGVELEVVTSQSYVGQSVAAVFPGLRGECGLVLEEFSPAAVAGRVDFCFVALPHKAAMAVVPPLLAAGIKVVDLSADFRFRDLATYEAWYQEHTAPELLAEAVYGLPELHAKEISEARLVGNPGCYPTAVILALAPLIRAGIVHLDSLIADCKSGVTGAGRSPSLGVHYCEVNDGLRAYKVGEHRHTPEIEQELSRLAGREVCVAFTPHLVPMSRGIFATIYARLVRQVNDGDIRSCYHRLYGKARFVRILDDGTLPTTQQVRGTNYCDIAWRLEERTGRIIVLSVIDNLTRGAAGQAVANMNLMCGFPLDAGLELRSWQP